MKDNSFDGSIGHSDNEIEMDGLEDTRVGNIMFQKGRSVFHDDPSGIVLVPGRILIVSIIILDHKKKMMINATDGDIGHFGNEIDMIGLDDSEDKNVDTIKPQVGRFVFPDGPSAIVVFFLTPIPTVSNIILDHTKKMRNSTIE